MTPSSNHAEFERLFAMHSRVVYAHIAALVGNRHDTDELFQETVALLWQKFDRYRADGDFRAWACRMAYHKVLKYRERRALSQRVFNDAAMEAIDEELIAVTDSLDVRIAALVECRKKLPQTDRRLLEQHYDKRMPVAALASAMQWSTRKVYGDLQRIHGLLHDCISKTIKEGFNAH